MFTHSFNTYHAELFGIEEAILIYHFQYWISLNKRLKRNFHDGKTWSYQTQVYIAAHFPYMGGRKKIERLIRSLVDQGVLITGNYNKVKFDQTKWYAFSDESLYIPNKRSLMLIIGKVCSSQNYF